MSEPPDLRIIDGGGDGDEPHIPTQAPAITNQRTYDALKRFVEDSEPHIEPLREDDELRALLKFIQSCRWRLREWENRPQ